MGYSFAAGTTDGAGAFTFNQGMTSPNELWNAVRDFIVTPSDKERKCQLPKPILFPTGEVRIYSGIKSKNFYLFYVCG